ncbi:RHS repeat-associated core domain-containing protein, partial [Geobacter grbiciae]|uniref:RHS repeat-associated core domain-containing protein n=1 Tax=Geobacter grbiciae TaxID=155042 RepID=UPI001C039417
FKYVGTYGVMSEPNGLYYMKARYYDPSVGRFISEDPKGLSGGDVNLMAYVQNNPINFIDPTGLDGVNVLSAITTFAGQLKSYLDPKATAGQLVTGIAVDSASHLFNIAPNQAVGDIGGLSASAVGARLAVSSGGTGAVALAGFGLGLSIGNAVNHLPVPFTNGLNVQQTITEGLINGYNPFKRGCGR